MKRAAQSMFFALVAALVAVASYKPSVPALPPHPSSKAISNVGMTPDHELSAAADAGKATQEIADMMPAATANEQDAPLMVAVVSLPTQGHGDGSAAMPVEASAVASYSPPTVAEQMLPYCNALGVYRVESPALTAAAQEQATFLSTHGYSMYSLANAPPGVTGHAWGNGSSQSRAYKHGFQGSLIAPNPGDPYHPIVGETIALRSIYDPAGVIASWNDRGPRSVGHWKPLVSPQYDVAGFGYAKNPQGEHIFVAMFGDSKSPAVARSETGVGSSYPTPSRTLPTAVYSTCGPNGCGPAMQGQSYQYQRRGFFGRR